MGERNLTWGGGRSALASDQMTGITLTTPLALWPKPHTMIHPHSPPISLLHHTRTHFRDSSAHWTMNIEHQECIQFLLLSNIFAKIVVFGFLKEESRWEQKNKTVPNRKHLWAYQSDYDAVSDVVESGGQWWSDFQIGSRVLKNCYKPILMAYNVIYA